MLTVSVITPTWQRHDFLLTRCIPSVQAQDYPNVEHVIVSDGPDPELAAKISSLEPGRHPIRFWQIPVREEIKYGTRARRYGIQRAVGDLIGYNDDDDALKPQHCRRHVEALLANPDALWSKSAMISQSPGGPVNIGMGHDPAAGSIGTPMVVHRRELLDVATWGEPGAFEDWELFSQWVDAGAKLVQIDEFTVDVWPSVYRQGQ